MKLQIEEYFMSPLFNLSHDIGTYGIEKLHSDLYKGLACLKLVKKIENFFLARKIAGYDHVFSHQWAPPVISFKF